MTKLYQTFCKLFLKNEELDSCPLMNYLPFHLQVNWVRPRGCLNQHSVSTKVSWRHSSKHTKAIIASWPHFQVTAYNIGYNSQPSRQYFLITLAALCLIPPRSHTCWWLHCIFGQWIPSLNYTGEGGKPHAKNTDLQFLYRLSKSTQPIFLKVGN